MDTTDLRKLLAEATKGPWHANTYGGEVTPGEYVNDKWGEDAWTVSGKPDETGWCTDSGTPGYGISEADARLIAAAVNALPALLDVVEAAEVVVDVYGDDMRGTLAALRSALARAGGAP